MRNFSALAALLGSPLLVMLVGIAFIAPSYAPSDGLRSAAASPDPLIARERMVASFGRRCRNEWNLDRIGRAGEASLWSWENDSGFIARTRISCIAEGRCTVRAGALIRWPAPRMIGGKPLPTPFFVCGGRRSPR